MSVRHSLCLAAVLFAGASAGAQPAQYVVFPPTSRPSDTAVLRVVGALGGELAVALAASLVLYGAEDNVPPILFLLIPITGAAGGATLVGHATDTPGTFSGAMIGAAIGSVPGIVVLAASGNSTDAELAGGLLFAGGTAVGAALGYGSPRLSLGLVRVPGGGIAPVLHARF